MDETENSCLIEDNWSINIDDNVPTTDEIVIIRDLLKKCRILATFTKKSYKIANFIHKNQILLKLNKTLHSDCESKWNSTYVLIENEVIIGEIVWRKKKFELKTRSDRKINTDRIE